MIRQAAIALLALALLAGCSKNDAGPAVTVERGWMRAPAPGAMMSAAYLEVVNNSGDPIVIDGVSSPQFGDASLHTTQMNEGRMQMRPIESLTIAPGGRAVLAPGADHIMLGDPRAALEGVAFIELTLTNSGTPVVTVEVPVSRS
ncbi:MAG: copper chaperone PCu(A)C, partial [Pseudomonadota bacterium]